MKRLAAVILILAMLCGGAWADTGSDVVDAAKLYLELMYLAYERNPEFVFGYVDEIFSYTLLYFAGESIKGVERNKALGHDSGLLIDGYAMVVSDLGNRYNEYRSGEMTLEEYMTKLMSVVKIFVHDNYK